MGWLRVTTSLVAAYVCFNLVRLFQNYRKARRSGFPVLILPIPTRSTAWLILGRPLRPLFQRLLPPVLFEYLDVGIMGWEFRSRGKGGVKLLDASGPRIPDSRTENFVLCTCSSPNVYYIGTPDLAFEILKRTKDFEPSDDTVKYMGVFGPTLASTRGEQWSKQRRLIAPQINEQYSRLVFDESHQQTMEMLDHFTALPDATTEDTLAGLRRIAINVLTAAGYGVTQHWEDESPESSANTNEEVEPRMRYISATREIINSFPESFILPATVLDSPVFPPAMRNVGKAVQNLSTYARNMLAHESKRPETSQVEGMRSNFLEMLMKQRHNNENHVDGEDTLQTEPVAKGGIQALSEDEIAGNLFGFTIAGFETTANTLAFAVTLLAAKPRWQVWVMEEIDEVVTGMPEEDLDYSKVYPKLKRCLAVMFETLRLFNPVVHLAKQPRYPTSIQTTEKVYHFEQAGEVYINQCAIQSNPEVWGSEALEFNPSRWLQDEDQTASSGAPSSIPPGLKGSFLPWSSGPRVCPGMKFSQVEFVSVIMTMFRKYRIEPVVKKGESKEQACDRLYGATETAHHKLTLQITHPKEIKLRYLERI